MSESGYAFFVRRPRRIEELICPHPLEAEREYAIVKAVTLKKIDFENFITDMLADRSFLRENAALCSSGAVIRCIRITCKGVPEAILAVPDAAWVELAAVVSASQGAMPTSRRNSKQEGGHRRSASETEPVT